MFHTYTVYDLTIQTTFACPALPRAPRETTPDIIVTEGATPRELAAPVATGKIWQAEPGRFLWRGGARAGRFLVEGGTRVTLQRSPTAEDEMLALHFLDSVLAAILRQRGMLVLHANAAVTPAGAVAISGESGAGKSTTLAALVARGCAMLTDDITALRLGHDGRVEALPGVPQLHLTEDAADGLGCDIVGLPRNKWRRMKAAVPAHRAMALEPAPLRALYLLQPRDGDGLRVQPLTGAEKFDVVQTCIYGPLLPQEHPGQFPLFAALVEQATVFRLERPTERWSVDDVVDTILTTEY
ncbi:MAG: hypothetical protein HY868_03540 [Chloroflexi bacterium]|nr:hypothetical protein [Chloroflexota bacterium]